ncbi:MAG: hypothetical protein IKM31_02190 [Oscillospiraceae bacterium]|nr:hypothetical protein [Oscillospiraceae bacterium]
MRHLKKILALLAAAVLLLAGCGKIGPEVFRSSADSWTVGFGRAEIVTDLQNDGTHYIAGYNQGWEPHGVFDHSTAWAVWLEAGKKNTLLIGVDCIALSTVHVEEIRERVAHLGSTSVNVYATHDHAGVDTLGLWGPLMVDGKNDAYMEKLMEACVLAAEDALADRRTGELRYGSAATEREFLRDSRDPQVFDPDLHQIRFVPEDGGAGVRLYLYGAHAEALRGDNATLSRDFPGVLCDLVEMETGDRAVFLPGAIGGLIMTQELVSPAFLNMDRTGRILADHALSITPEDETVIEPVLVHGRKEFSVPLDNTGFMFYKFLGILDKEVTRADSATGYALSSEMTVLQLGGLTLALIPGEIFPELVWGGAREPGLAEDPPLLCDIAAEHGAGKLLVVGLANDELGYIVPPSDFLLNDKIPYLDTAERDQYGENHYEETNSVGPECAPVIAETFAEILDAMTE